MKLTRFIVPILLYLSTSPFWGIAASGAAGVQANSLNSDAKALKARFISEATKRQTAGMLNGYQEDRLRDYLSSTPTTIDTLRILALQVQFSDSLMGGQPGSSRDQVRDSTWFANELKHVEQYYDGASRNNLVVSWEVTSRLYNLPLPMGYYGDEVKQDERVVEMMQSAIDSADGDVDFSQFDTYMLVHPGPGQETDILDNSRDQLWSSFLDREDIRFAFPDSTVDGLLTGDSLNGEPFLVTNFMVVPSTSSQDGITIGTLGIWAFEVGSRLGLLPLFDTTPEIFPDSRGIGDYGLMGSGIFNASGFVPAFPCAFNRMLAGWLDPMMVEGNGSYQLRDINKPMMGDTAALRIPITEGEYFLVVNRVHDSNFDSLFTFSDFDSNLIPDNTDSLGGAEFDFFVTDLTNPFIVKPDPNFGGILRRFVDTGSGVYVWHVDESVIRQTLQTGFLPNDFVSRKGVDLEEADGVQDLDNVGSVFSFGSHFDSFRAGNNTVFGPSSNPNSMTNGGADTGVLIKDISVVGPVMTLNVEISKPYDETRTRWKAKGDFQTATAFDLDGVGGEELVVFADTGRVYAFNNDGSEYLDRDLDATTIHPYFLAPGSVWRGAPAFGNIDGGADDEIVAASQDGTVYAWKGDSTEVFDGDGDGATNGILYQGLPIAAPPLLVDIDGDGNKEIAIVEQVSDSLRLSFVDATGNKKLPSDVQLQSLWPAKIHAQFCAPLAFGAMGRVGEDSEGIVVAWLDTAQTLYGVSYFPVRHRTGGNGQAWEFTLKPRAPVVAAFPPMPSPSIGDVDANGYDDVAVTLRDGRLVVFGKRPIPAPDSPPIQELFVTDLRSSNPSAPAMGDVDGNGTLEIAVLDDEYYYLYEHNARLVTNWPQPVRPNLLGDFPELAFEKSAIEPLMGDFNGDNRIEILFPSSNGIMTAFRGDGVAVSGSPRAIPSGIGASPVVGDMDGDDELSLVTLGVEPRVGHIDAVNDSVVFADMMVLSIQSLPNSSAQDKFFWTMYRQDRSRLARTTESNPLQKVGTVAEENTFIIYPNPVKGAEVHARIILNAQATVRVEIYNLEGEKAVNRSFTANVSNVVQSPFDEIIAVDHLKSGVYMLRLLIETASGSDSFVKAFAVRR